MATPSPKRTVLITGCSDGSLGSALCLAFHRAGGWRVIASARNPAKLKQVEAAGIETVQLDTLSDESIAAAAARVSELLSAPGGSSSDSGSLDMLINNAGAGYAMPLLDVDLARARRLFDLNVFSPLAVTRAFLPLLMKSTSAGGGGGGRRRDGGGVVVNNTSCSSLTTGGLPFAGAYNASKAALLSLNETLRLELAPLGVRVVNLMTGAVRSTFHDNAKAAPGAAVLPPGSLYNVAKEAVERAMSGVDAKANGTDPTEWAEGVVRALIGGAGTGMGTMAATATSSSSPRPPHWIWRGKYSTIIRITSLFPVGWFDRLVKRMVGLDVLERRLEEQKVFKQG